MPESSRSSGRPCLCWDVSPFLRKRTSRMSHPQTGATGTATWLDQPESETAHSDRVPRNELRPLEGSRGTVFRYQLLTDVGCAHGACQLFIAPLHLWRAVALGAVSVDVGLEFSACDGWNTVKAVDERGVPGQDDIWICKPRVAGGRCKHALNRNEVAGHPLVHADLPFRVGTEVPGESGIEFMQARSPFPRGVESSVRNRDDRVHVAHVVGRASCERSDEQESSESRERPGPLHNLDNRRPLAELLGVGADRPLWESARHAPTVAPASMQSHHDIASLTRPLVNAATIVALPSKSDTVFARENKIDDVSAVLRYGVVSTMSVLPSTAGTTPYPRVVE